MEYNTTGDLTSLTNTASKEAVNILIDLRLRRNGPLIVKVKD